MVLIFFLVSHIYWWNHIDDHTNQFEHSSVSRLNTTFYIKLQGSRLCIVTYIVNEKILSQVQNSIHIYGSSNCWNNLSKGNHLWRQRISIAVGLLSWNTSNHWSKYVAPNYIQKTFWSWTKNLSTHLKFTIFPPDSFRKVLHPISPLI